MIEPLFDLPPIPHPEAAAQRRFHPSNPTATPSDLYNVTNNRGSVPRPRYICKSNPREMLIFIDGSCLHNGTPRARAGFGIQWSPEDKFSGRLEGPGLETSNRAELRAAIVALSIRTWNGEGFDTVVLACDSEYVVLGICERIQTWIQRGWRTSGGSPVMNRDLWEELLAKLEERNNAGVMVKFWRIPRDFNVDADQLARAGARKRRERSMKNIAVVDCPPGRNPDIIFGYEAARLLLAA